MSSYWDNKGKYQTEYSTIWNKYVPNSGKAEIPLVEALRCISIVNYDYHNNGFMNLLDHICDENDNVLDTFITDSYIEDIDTLIPFIGQDKVKELKKWCISIEYGNIKWGENGDEILDNIIDSLIELILKTNLL